MIFLALGISTYKIISGNFGSKGSKVSKVFSDADKRKKEKSFNNVEMDNIEQVEGWSSVKAVRKRRFSTRDIVLMLVVTGIFAVLVLFRLGSHRVPETYQDFKVGEKGQNEIILNFNGKVNLSKIYIYLGYNSKRSISFSCWDEASKGWNVLDANHNIESAFAWNEVDFNNREFTSLGMVLMEGEARIHEIVCVDSNGNRVFPSNADNYPNLFDEQGLFPGIRTYYDQSMFDEVYHARTAYEFLHQLPIYENTHPPLGKTIISIGIKIFGMNPFGWRIMCAIAGILMMPLMYLLAFYMFRKTSTAFFAAIILGTGFMNFALARIATLDIIVAFFVLLMFALMFGFVKALEKGKSLKIQFLWLFLCGLAMGVAISVKWTGVWCASRQVDN